VGERDGMDVYGVDGLRTEIRVTVASLSPPECTQTDCQRGTTHGGTRGQRRQLHLNPIVLFHLYQSNASSPTLLHTNSIHIIEITSRKDLIGD
jgi:hypothetical protein